MSGHSGAEARTRQPRTDFAFGLFTPMSEASSARVRVYRLGKGSVLPGAVFPICSDLLRIGELTVRCPRCNGYSHDACWMYAGGRCGRVACTGQGEIESARSVERSPIHISGVQTVEARKRIKILGLGDPS